MALKLLVPVLPSDRFYDAVVAAADLLTSEGGLLTFLFTDVRPPGGDLQSDDGGGHPSDLEIQTDAGDIDPRTIERWREQQVAALEEAREILYERGVEDDRIDYAFADFADHESAAQAICDEAAAGAYDMVVLARGYLEDEVIEQGSRPEEVLDTLHKTLGDEVKVLVT